jgi:integrase
LSDAERERLLEICRQSRDARLYPLVVLAIATGARQAELIGLRWSDVDLQRRSAILHKTKNGERRSLPLTGLALKLLRELEASRRPGSDHVFPGRRRKPAFPRRAWEVAAAAAGLEDFRFHDLRHSCASYLAMSAGAAVPSCDICHVWVAALPRSPPL